MSATLRIPPQRRTPYWANRSQSLVCGYPIPGPHHCTYQNREMSWGSVYQVAASYEVPGGPRWRAAAGYNFWDKLERKDRMKTHSDLTRMAYLHVVAGVKAHNAVVEPIDNGPDDRVAASEARTRVVLAMRTAFRDRREGLVLDDLQAADQRLCRLPYVGI